jgi:hypothetical protein
MKRESFIADSDKIVHSLVKARAVELFPNG